jgi:hypothetical protein
MAVTLDQTSLGTLAASGVGAGGATFNTTNAIATGGMAVILAGRFYFTAATAITASGGGLTWNVAHTFQSGNLRVSLIYAFAPAGLASGTTITINSTGSDVTLLSASYLGVDTSGTVVSTGNSTATNTAWTSGSVTATAGNAIIGGAFGDGTLSTSTASAGTERGDFNSGTTSGNVTLVDKLSSAGGSDNVAGTWTNSLAHLGIVAEFKAAAGGGATPVRLLGTTGVGT